MLQSVTDLIGHTPVLPLRRLASPDHARVAVKLEAHNPTGSMKDRAALAIVQRAAESGRLKPGDTIVECTSGSTGTSLSSVAVALGYRCLLVTPMPSATRSSRTCARSALYWRSSPATRSASQPNS